MLYIIRRVTFSAAHRLHNLKLSDKENKNIYGECNNPNGHGHNYVLEVTVRGNVPDKTGMVIDLKDLKKIITENIIEKVDHKYLNKDVDFMSDIIPTAENLVIQFWKILKEVLLENNAELYELKLYETENNIVVYRGE
ncbi:MAG: 6-carboxytetrahydropterin synthase [Nitrospinota bacterium]